jgi:hypothetical protein
LAPHASDDDFDLIVFYSNLLLDGERRSLPVVFVVRFKGVTQAVFRDAYIAMIHLDFSNVQSRGRGEYYLDCFS